MVDSNLVLLHLSDIHFRKREIFDIDADLRNELETDVHGLSTGEVGSVNGVLISGDIAFSGEIAQYETALTWLESLCQKLNCSSENVWCIPGNHDVNRKVLEESKLIRTIQNEIRVCEPERLDELIDEYLEDGEARQLLYKPIENYLNEFASKFGCEISPENPSVIHNFGLNDGSILRIKGINSTLISFSKDNDGLNRLVAGSYQSTINRESGVEYLLMCHHPYPWLKDDKDRKEHWTQRAKIHLFGHKHNQHLEKGDNWLEMTAGAMHPDRREPFWLPRYNVLAINVSKVSGHRQLNLKVYQRFWNKMEQKFCPEKPETGESFAPYSFKLDDWESEIAKEQTPIIVSKSRGKSKPIDKPKEDIQMNSLMDPSRRLAYRFLRLPYHVRINIAHDLDLLEDKDKGLHDTELFQNLFHRAKEKNKLKDLWEKVEIQHGNEATENPFAK